MLAKKIFFNVNNFSSLSSFCNNIFYIKKINKIHHIIIIVTQKRKEEVYLSNH